MSTAAPARQGIPLRPDPLARDREQRRSLIRAITGIALSGDERAEKIVARTWANDNLASMIVKTAITPMTMTSSGLPLVTSIDVLPSLAPMSAAVRLFSRCLRVNLDGVYQVSVPRGVAGTVPIFIGEGMPAPVIKLNFPDAFGPPRKILVTSAVTAELENSGPEIASDIVGRVIAEATTRNLDAIVFDDLADDGVRPAGLLHGLTPIVATAGGGLAAIAADLGNLAGAIADAGVDAEDMVVVANSRQAIQLKLLSGPNFDYPVFGTPMVPPGRVIAIAVNSVASAYSGIPTIEKSKNPALHFEDTNPLPIVSAAGVAAAPVMSAFQTDMIAIKVRCFAAWNVVAPGISYIDNVSW